MRLLAWTVFYRVLYAVLTAICHVILGLDSLWARRRERRYATQA